MKTIPPDDPSSTSIASAPIKPIDSVNSNTEVADVAAPPATSGSIATVAHVNGLKCPSCRRFIALPDGDRRWYAIWKARKIGWVQGSYVASSLLCLDFFYANFITARI